MAYLSHVEPHPNLTCSSPVAEGYASTDDISETSAYPVSESTVTRDGDSASIEMDKSEEEEEVMLDQVIDLGGRQNIGLGIQDHTAEGTARKTFDDVGTPTGHHANIPLPNGDDIEPKSPYSPKTWGSNFWVLITDPITSTTFYANPSTGDCTWDPPNGAFILPQQAEGEFWELSDEKRGGRKYYYHTGTGTVQWQKPEGPNKLVIPLGVIQMMSAKRGRKSPEEHSNRSPGVDEEFSGPASHNTLGTPQTPRKSILRHGSTDPQNSYLTPPRHVTYKGSTSYHDQQFPSSNLHKTPHPKAQHNDFFSRQNLPKVYQAGTMEPPSSTHNIIPPLPSTSQDLPGRGPVPRRSLSKLKISPLPLSLSLPLPKWGKRPHPPVSTSDANIPRSPILPSGIGDLSGNVATSNDMLRVEGAYWEVDKGSKDNVGAKGRSASGRERRESSVKSISRGRARQHTTPALSKDVASVHNRDSNLSGDCLVSIIPQRS